MIQRSRSASFLLGSLLCATPAVASLPQETYRVEASDGAPSDFFAFDLDVQGAYAIAGAHNHDSGLEEGAAYVFDWATGAELHKLLPSAPLDRMGFGWSVALNGSTAVVGAKFDDTPMSFAGRAYVYDLSTGSELGILAPTDPSSAKFFGESVDVDGNLALVGASGDANRSGAGYLFDLTTGTQLAKWIPSNVSPSGLDGYGYRVAIDGDYGILTRPDGVAVFDVATGAELYLLSRPGSFGRSVDAKDGLLVVGAINDATQGSGAGAAYVFDLASGVELAKLLAYDGHPGDGFGVGVGISDSHVVVGAFSTDAQGDNAGSTYLFDRATFQQVARLLPSDGQASDRFGRTVAIDGTGIFACSVGFDGLRGSAYRFDTPALDVGSPSCFGLSCPCGSDDPSAGCPNATGSGALLSASGTASIAADDLVLTTTSLPANQFGIYFMGDAHGPAMALGNGLRCASGSLFRFPVQSTGAGEAQLGPGIASMSCTTLPSSGCITAGVSWTFQLWYRDGGSSCPATSNTSNALTVLFTP